MKLIVKGPIDPFRQLHGNHNFIGTVCAALSRGPLVSLELLTANQLEAIKLSRQKFHQLYKVVPYVDFTFDEESD